MFGLIARSLRFHWRIHVAVALGVAAATAVLTGALIVGDSVRGSLRALGLERLGRIDELLIVDRFIRQDFASDLAAQPGFAQNFSAAVPAILYPAATVELSSGDARRRAAGVTVVGSQASFWQMGDTRFAATRPPAAGQIVLNAPLAEQLGAQIGDKVVLRLGKTAQIPADSPLGRKTDRIASVAELEITQIIPAESLGRFSLQPTQLTPLNAYVDLQTLQEGLDAAGQINAVLVAGKSAEVPPTPAAEQSLAGLLNPQLADYGLALKHVRRTFAANGNEELIVDYFSLSSDRMMLDAATEREAKKAFEQLGAEPVFTYLANDISLANKPDKTGIPYSTITGIEPTPGGPLVDAMGNPLPPLADDEIALTSWTADDLQAALGDRIRITYFEPETTHGDEQEASAEFKLAAIVPLTEPSKGYTRRAPAVFTSRPTPANDPDLTPEVKGITDQASIADWDAPFPFDYKRLRDQDDAYWEHHRTTPKAYVSLATARKLWGGRFGEATSIRIPAAPGLTEQKLAQRLIGQLRADDESLGLAFRPIKRQALAASSGTTPFDVLFLLLSMFIIAAALVLVWLLFRLGIEQRAAEIGTLLALGWKRQSIGRLLVLEGAAVAATGAAAGIALGIGYAWLMLTGLSTWWVGAIATPFLALHVTPLSLIGGFLAGLVVSLATIWLGLYGLRKVPVRQLLAGEAQPDRASLLKNRPKSRFAPVAIGAMLAAAIGLAAWAPSLGGEMQAVVFLAAGAMVLIALLLAARAAINRSPKGENAFASGTLLALALRNAGRNPGRSITTIALIATAAFLIVSVSSFRLAPTDRGTGGFQFLAESSEPVIADLNSPEERRNLFGSEAEQLHGTTVFAFRLRPGDDASCLNLYQPSQPRVLGVSAAFVQHFNNPQRARFGWAASAAQTPEEKANPWKLLAQEQSTAQANRHSSDQAPIAVPVVLDKNTAMYSLKLYGGIGETFEFTYGERPVTFRVAGLLDNSVLQGSLLIGEADFTRLFPQTSGYRFFLIDTPSAQAEQVAALLEDRLGDEGFDTTKARSRLADLLAVQNTYISTFQSLGALGLLLGTFGLAAVQLRSVFERRKELALMRAAGFRGLRLAQMVFVENLLLLLGGLAIGVFAALVAVLPHMLVGGAQIPARDLALLLATVVLVGLLAGMLAIRSTIRAPLVSALRGE